MKILKYNLCTKINRGTEENPDIQEILSPVTMGWNESNEEIAKREAYNGEYEIVDDGVEEVVTPETGDVVTWSELNGAYEAGYSEGYTEGVYCAYD